MAHFETAANVLASGGSVQGSNWEPITRMFVKDGELMCQRGEDTPYSYQLSWYELQAENWITVEPARINKRNLLN